jgi:hypothetical protein
VSSWLPEGRWTDFFTNVTYAGERMVQLHRPIGQYPVLARAGAIVPLTGADELGVGNPTSFEVHVFPGADGEFVLYEDDDAAAPRVVRTRLAWNDGDAVFTVGAAEGELDVVPAMREWTVVLHGVGSAEVEAGEVTSVEQGLRIELGMVLSGTGAVVRLSDVAAAAHPTLPERLFEVLRNTQGEYLTKDRAWQAISRKDEPVDVLRQLDGIDLPDPLRAALYELLLAV